MIQPELVVEDTENGKRAKSDVARTDDGIFSLLLVPTIKLRFRDHSKTIKNILLAQFRFLTKNTILRTKTIFFKFFGAFGAETGFFGRVHRALPLGRPPPLVNHSRTEVVKIGVIFKSSMESGPPPYLGVTFHHSY